MTHPFPTLLIGLGNIGRKYESTRHNVGFMVIDEIFATHRPTATLQMQHSVSCRITLQTGQELTLAKPTTYMNLSGLAAEELLQKEQKSVHDLLVIVDDFALTLGSLRLRRSGSAGGHNGLESLIESLGTNEFSRLRVGIGPLPPGSEVTDFVLGRFSGDENELLRKVVTRGAEAAIFAAVHGPTAAMDRYNKTIE